MGVGLKELEFSDQDSTLQQWIRSARPIPQMFRGGCCGVLKDGNGREIRALAMEIFVTGNIIELFLTDFRGHSQPCLMTEGRCFSAEGAGTD